MNATAVVPAISRVELIGIPSRRDEARRRSPHVRKTRA